MIDKRHNERRTVTQVGWIATESQVALTECRLHDISQSGAKLSLTCSPEALSENFDLFLTADRMVGRKCKIVWRTEQDVGVAFVGRTNPPVVRADGIETDNVREDEVPLN
jgi:hypothetical protein